MHHLSTTTILIIAALGASLYLWLKSKKRLFPTVAALASGVELVLALGIVSLSVAKYRIDAILPAVLAISGIACWSKSSTKGAITAATAIAVIGTMQLLLALRLFS